MCPKRSELNEFFDNETSSAENMAIEKHLKACSSCKLALEGFQKIHLLLAHDKIPNFLSIPTVQSFFLTQRKQQVWQILNKERSFFKVPIYIFSMAASFTLILVSFLYFTNNLPSNNTPEQIQSKIIPISTSERDQLLKEFNKLSNVSLRVPANHLRLEDIQSSNTMDVQYVLRR